MNAPKTPAELGAITTGSLTIALRESRLIVERLLMQTGMPSGCLVGVREAVIVSEALRLGGYARLSTLQPTLGAATTEPLRIEDGAPGAPLVVQANGQHAWLIAQALVDLLLAEAAAGGAMSLRVHGSGEPGELAVVLPLAARLGAVIELRQDANGVATLTLLHRAPPPPDRTDALLWRVIRDGLEVDAVLWWSLYHRSMAALAPDSVVSRRHAGANVVDDGGRVLGRMTDDDTDFNLLRKPAATSNESQA